MPGLVPTSVGRMGTACHAGRWVGAQLLCYAVQKMGLQSGKLGGETKGETESGSTCECDMRIEGPRQGWQV